MILLHQALVNFYDQTGHDQGVAVSRLVKDAGYSEIRIHKDLEQKDRVVSCLRE